MTIQKKRSLYKSIMEDVATTVKQHLNGVSTSRRQSDNGSLTYDDFNDPAKNKLFQSMAPNHLCVTGNKISLIFDIKDIDDDDDDGGSTLIITRYTMAEVIKSYRILLLALISLDKDKYRFYNCVVDKNFRKLAGTYLHMLDDDEDDVLDKWASKLTRIIEANRNFPATIDRFCREGMNMTSTVTE